VKSLNSYCTSKRRHYYLNFNPINYTGKDIRWADYDGAALPGHPETEVEQAPSSPSFSKIQFNIRYVVDKNL